MKDSCWHFYLVLFLAFAYLGYLLPESFVDKVLYLLAWPFLFVLSLLVRLFRLVISVFVEWFR